MAKTQFQVFISYNSIDEDWVQRLKNALVAKGVTVWLDKERIRPGDLVASALEIGLEQSESVALVVSKKTMESGWVQMEYYRALGLFADRKTQLRLIPVIRSTGAKLPGFLQIFSAVDFSDKRKFSENVELLRRGITGEAPIPIPGTGIPSDRLQNRFGLRGLTHWRHEVTKEGVICRSQSEKIAPVLLVYVHGLRGDARRTWNLFPEALVGALREAAANAAGAVSENSSVAEQQFDIFSYGYSAGLFVDSHSEQAASILRHHLGYAMMAYDHIVFITHSAGGLVVKRLMVEDMQAMSEDVQAANRRGEARWEDSGNHLRSRSIAFRTRRIFNIAVPHHGVEPGLSCNLLHSYRKAWPVVAPVVKLFTIVKRIPLLGVAFKLAEGQSYGRNRIVDEITIERGQLGELNEQHVGLRKRFVGKDLPIPAVVEIRGHNDQEVDGGPGCHYFLGDHPSVKRVSSSSDGIVKFMANWLLPLLDKTAVALAGLWLGDHDEKHGVVELTRIDPPCPELETPGRATVPKCQQSAFQQLRSFCSEQRLDPHRASLVVLTGAAGTGKTVVLEQLARTLSGTYLNSACGQPLPILIPLQHIHGAPSDADLWEHILEVWPSPKPFALPPGCSPVWFEKRIESEKTILILDSADELIMNNRRTVTPERFRAMVNKLRKQWGSAQVSLVIGIRSTERVFNLITEDADETIEIASVVEEEAQDRWGEGYAVTQLAADEATTDTRDEMLRTLRTPLLLSVFTHPAQRPNRRLRRLADVFEYALDAWIRRSHLDEPEADSDRWKDACMLVAAAFVLQNRSTMTIDEVMHAAPQLRSFWENLESKSFTPQRQGELNAACDLLSDREQLRTLFIRGPFDFAPETQSQAFSHRSWFDHLLGRYFREGLRAGNFLALKGSAFSLRAHRTGGELLASDAWKGFDTWSEIVVKQMQEPFGQFILGNFSGLLANSIVPVTGDGLKAIVEARDLMPGAGKVVLFAGLGFRALKFSEPTSDPNCAVLRKHLIVFYREMLAAWHQRARANEPAPANSSSAHERLCAGISWLYLTEFADRFKTRPPSKKSWPGLVPKEKEAEVVDKLFNVRKGDEWVKPVEPVFQNCQEHISILAEEELRLEPAHRPVSSAHYLYFLLIAAKQGIALESARAGLPSMFTDAANPIRHHRIKELRQFYEHCEKIFTELQSL